VLGVAGPTTIDSNHVGLSSLLDRSSADVRSVNTK
jgi:hypothetical protein